MNLRDMLLLQATMIRGTRGLPGLVLDMLFSWNLLEPWDMKQGIIGNQVKAPLI